MTVGLDPPDGLNGKETHGSVRTAVDPAVIVRVPLEAVPTNPSLGDGQLRDSAGGDVHLQHAAFHPAADATRPAGPSSGPIGRS